MARQINVDAIARALAGKTLGVHAYVAVVKGETCRCAAGELAHVAGLSDDTLRTIDIWHGEKDGQGTSDERSAFEYACAELDVVLFHTYGILPTDRDVLQDANDKGWYERTSRVIDAARGINQKLIDDERALAHLSAESDRLTAAWLARIEQRKDDGRLAAGVTPLTDAQFTTAQTQYRHRFAASPASESLRTTGNTCIRCGEPRSALVHREV